MRIFRIFDKIPIRILLDELSRVLRFFKASFNALTSSFITFENFVAILALRRTEGYHGNFVILHVRLQINASKLRDNSSPNVLTSISATPRNTRFLRNLLL